ncbi:VWA domain-containing protein, partial [Candidatus Woesearchaeota archaeon]|nr:VWA domain-containing protein [Candidatus Woesearchaeota archaeon]
MGLGLDRRNIRRNKKAFYYTMDALFAAMLLVGGLLLISQNLVKSYARESIEYLSTDVLIALSELQMSEINSTYVNNNLMGSSYTNLNLTVLEQIGTYWAANETNLALNLSEYVLNNVFPNKTGMNLVIESDVLYQKNWSESNTLVTGGRMITGIMQGAPLTGSTSSAYLRKIDDKRDSSFAYFGGFFGQGNVSIFVDGLPSDVDNETITMVEMEVDAGGQFALYINGDKCGDFTPTVANMTPNYWNITSCKNSIQPGRNDFDVIFDANINQSYIAGGFIKISYKTSQQQQNISTGTKKYHFPGVVGVANLYDAFYIPGTLTNMTIYLHYDTDAKSYLTIGDTIVYQDNASGDTQVYLYDSNLTQFPINLNYNDLSNRTIPLRFASYNETYTYVFGSNADVVLITDLSGSMKLRMNSWSNPGNSIPGCKPADIIDPKSRRLGVAACLDSEVNAIIMNSSRTNNTNRMWLVDFSDDANPFFSPNLALLTEANIEQEIFDRYKSKSQQEIKGGTCLCCAINQAYDILNTYSSENRSKSVIVMTDGVPTHCCGLDGGGGCNETSTGTTGFWLDSDCTGDENACDINDCDGPINNAINAAQRLHQDLNTTVHAVGFGPIENCTNANYTVHKVAEVGNGSVIVSQNASVLQEFYWNVSTQIIAEVSQTSQLISVEGNLTPSNLYNDSYIEFLYDPIVDPPQPNEISVVVQTDQFGGCNPSVTMYPGIRVADARVVSYSDYHWTDTLMVDGTSVFNLSFFSSDYVRLGDPYEIQVPVNLLTNGTHSLTIGTGDSPINYTGCSDNNSLIYTALVPSTTARSGVVEKIEGCVWNLQFEDDTFSNKSIPEGYSGSNR